MSDDVFVVNLDDLTQSKRNRIDAWLVSNGVTDYLAEQPIVVAGGEITATLVRIDGNRARLKWERIPIKVALEDIPEDAIVHRDPPNPRVVTS